MWSLGVLLFTMLTSHYPFSTEKLSSTTSTSYLRSLLTVRDHLMWSLFSCCLHSIWKAFSMLETFVSTNDCLLPDYRVLSQVISDHVLRWAPARSAWIY